MQVHKGASKLCGDGDITEWHLGISDSGEPSGKSIPPSNYLASFCLDSWPACQRLAWAHLRSGDQVPLEALESACPGNSADTQQCLGNMLTAATRYKGRRNVPRPQIIIDVGVL